MTTIEQSKAELTPGVSVNPAIRRLEVTDTICSRLFIAILVITLVSLILRLIRGLIGNFPDPGYFGFINLNNLIMYLLVGLAFTAGAYASIKKNMRNIQLVSKNERSQKFLLPLARVLYILGLAAIPAYYIGLMFALAGWGRS